MEVNEVNQMISIAKQYYELGMSQEQIANHEYISKSSVSRLLKKSGREWLCCFSDKSSDRVGSDSGKRILQVL